MRSGRVIGASSCSREGTPEAVTLLLDRLEVLDRRGERRPPAGGYDSCVPAWRSSTCRRVNGVDVEPGRRDEPGDEGVGVPHRAGAELVASPGRPGDERGHLEKPLCIGAARGELPRALDRLVEVRDVAVGPDPQLVPEQPESPCPRRPDRPLADDAAIRSVARPDRSRLDARIPRRMCEPPAQSDRGRMPAARPFGTQRPRRSGRRSARNARPPRAGARRDRYQARQRPRGQRGVPGPPLYPRGRGSSSREKLDRLELLERLAAAVAVAERAARGRPEDVLEARLGRVAVRAAKDVRL